MLRMSSFIVCLWSLLGSIGVFLVPSIEATLTCAGDNTTYDSENGVCYCEIIDDAENNSGSSTEVYIAGLFDTESYDWGLEIFNFTASLINNHSDGWNDDIFDDGTFLKWRVADTACDASVAAKAYWGLRTENGNVPMHGIVGARCSGASIELARIAGLEGVTQVSPASTSIKLSDDEEFRFFNRVISAEETKAFVALFRLFEWDKVSIISTDTPFAKDLDTEFKRLWVGEHNDASGAWEGSVAYSHTVIIDDADGTVNAASVRQGLEGMPTGDSRVVFLNAHNQHGYPILKIAQEMNLPPDTIWIGAWGDRLPLDGDLSWLPSIPGYLGITPLRNRNADYADYLSRLQNAQRAEGRQPWDDLPDYAAEYMVDSIVAIARALSSLPTALRRNGSNVTSQLRGLTFQGISGETSFTKEGDRLNPRYTIYNMQNSNRSGAVWVPVGEVGVDVGSAFLTEGIGSICWAGVDFGCGLDEPPSDQYPVPPDPPDPLDVWIPIVIAVIAVLLLFVTWKYFGVRKKMGEMKNIDNELVDIQEQVEAAKLKQASLILKRSALQEKPDTWSDSTERLVPVPAEDDQYWTIDARLKATMPDAHISKLWRVQNTSLWTYYSFHRDRLTMHDISHNERSVWHGTSGLDPAIIYNDQLDGFMMQFAAKGFWGRGIYFADKSEYSHSYAYDPPAGSASSTWSRSSSTSFTPGSERSGGLPGEREMFLAKLLVGSSIELPRDQTLTVPPHDPTNNLKYNSVTGETGGSKVWIVYENGRAYPDYLVRYYRGKRDPKRTPYKSKRQAMKRADVDEMDADTMETGQVGGVSLNLDVPFTWMYLDSGGWVPYSSCHQSILENKHQVFVNDNSISSKVQIQTDEWTYEVDVKQMVQTNMGHADSRTRNVRRVVETGQAGGAI